jgi:hypothetical protein
MYRIYFHIGKDDAPGERLDQTPYRAFLYRHDGVPYKHESGFTVEELREEIAQLRAGGV